MGTHSPRKTGSNLPGRLLDVRELIDRARSSGGSVGTEDRGIAIPATRLGRQEVSVIREVEEFRPELDVERFRDARHPEVFHQREIRGEEVWTVNAIAADVAQQIRTIRLPGGCGCCCTGERSARERQRR